MLRKMGHQGLAGGKEKISDGSSLAPEDDGPCLSIIHTRISLAVHRGLRGVREGGVVFDSGLGP